MNFTYAILSSVFVSLRAFVGAVSMLLRENILKKILLLLVAFGVGSLIGATFLSFTRRTFKTWEL